MKSKFSKFIFQWALAFTAIMASEAGIAAERAKLRISASPIVDTAPLFIAQKLGFFEKEGIEIDTRAVQGAAGLMGVIGNSYDIALTSVVSSILAHDKNLGIQVIAPGSQMLGAGETTHIVGPKDLLNATGATLEGKRIAINERNTVLWLYASAWVKNRGGDTEKTVLREVPLAQMEDAIRQKRVDAAFMIEPFKSSALKNPDLTIIGKPFSEIQPGADVGHWIASRKFVENNRDLIDRFNRALRKGVDWYNANRSSKECLEIVSGITRISVDTLKDMNLPPMPTAIHMDQIKKTAELMRTHGMLQAVPDFENYAILPAKE